MSTSAIVVVGATGLLGEALIDLLSERADLGVEVIALASARSAGKRVEFGARRLKVGDVHDFVFAPGQIVLFCAPGKIAAKVLPRVRESGAQLIDFSGSRAEQPPALPWVPGGSIDAQTAEFRAAPAAIAHAALSLAPLQALTALEDVRVTVLQAVSGRGRRGVEELAGQAARLLNVQPFDAQLFPAQIAFNALPDVSGVPDEADELAALLGLPTGAVSVARAWVSVFHGQSLQIDVLSRRKITERDVIAAWGEISRLEWHSEATLSPVTDGSRGDVVNLGGLTVRDRPGGGSRVSYWSIADDVRVASAANGIAISEILIKPGQ